MIVYSMGETISGVQRLIMQSISRRGKKEYKFQGAAVAVGSPRQMLG